MILHSIVRSSFPKTFRSFAIRSLVSEAHIFRQRGTQRSGTRRDIPGHSILYTLYGMLKGAIVTFYRLHHTDLGHSDGGFFEKYPIGPSLENQYIKCFVVS